MSRARPVSILLLGALLGVASLVATRTPAQALTPAEAKASMTVTLVRSDAKDCGADCPEWIALTGKIVLQTPALLSGVLARTQGKHLPILVDSPGGAVEPALAMGRMIRARKLDVAVAGTALTDCAPGDRACFARARGGERPGYVAAGVTACASACVYVLAAGTARVVGPNTYVGVHQMTANRTFTRVINTFRIMRRVVNGRMVEVSRTLVGTRPVSSYVVKSAAPNQTYSEVDRYLLGMGIDESIMPLMHGTPPTGMHWMLPAELKTTRIATDTSDAKSLVDREGAQAILAKLPAAVTGISALVPDKGRGSLGAATWRIEAAAGNVPRLVVEVDIPERRLTGRLTIVRSTDPAASAAYTGVVALVSAEPGSMVAEARPPRFCDPTICMMPMTPDPSSGTAGDPFTFDVPPGWGDGFLSSLRSRDWLEIPVRTSGGWGMLTIAMTGAVGTTIETWEHLCCGLAMPDGPPRAAPTPPLPAPSRTPVAPIPPAPPPAPAAATGGDRVPYTVSLEAGGPFMQGMAAVAWTPFEVPDAVDQSGHPSLRADVAVPEADLVVSMKAEPGALGSAGHMIFELDPVANPKTFGPVSWLVVSPISGSAKGDAVRLISSTERRGGYTVELTIDPDAPAGSAVRFDLGDSAIRAVTLTIPIDDQIRNLVRAAGRRRDATN